MKNILIFLGGAAIGSVATWKLVEKKYRDLADNEIESVISTFKEREKEFKKEESKDENKTTDTVKLHYEDTLDALQYVSDDIKKKEDELINPKTKAKKVKPKTNNGPIIITPEEFGELDDYITKSWTFYDNGILADESDEVVESPSVFIGDALEHFGDYEDDSVYVRNANEKCDYEILKSEKDYNL